MTFIYELDPNSQEIYRMCKYELPTSRLTKVIIWQTETQTSYAWSLPVTWQRWRSQNSIRHSQKPHATRKPDGSIFYRTGVMGITEVYIAGIGIMDVFGSCDLDLDPMTFIYELDSYVKMWTSYVNAFESYRLTDRQTQSTHNVIC